MNIESRIAAAVLSLGLAMESAATSAATTESLVVSFSNDSAGAYPVAGLIRDSAGNLYGTTSSGGSLGNGAIYEITASGTLVTLYSFKGSDGSFPNSALLRDAAGNLFGTTSSGGAANFGTVFELSAAGTLTTLYSFGNGADGAIPNAGLTADGLGRYYGTTSAGGTSGYGTVYSLSTSGTSFSTLYSFTNGTNGASPSALATDGLGNFFGVTAAGGSNAYGTLFELTGTTLTTLYSFTGASDGANPVAALLYANDGKLYGTTPKAGINSYGTLFQLTPAGVSSNIKTLYAFTNSSDGAAPLASLIQGEDGSLFGTTSVAGSAGLGGAFQISTLGIFSPLYGFNGSTTDGGDPVAGLVYASSGNFYGTTVQGGANNEGAVYRITVPPLAPATLTATTADAAITLNWTAGAYASTYNVYEGTSAGSESVTAVATNISGTSTTISGLSNGTTYDFTVASVNSAGVSSQSIEATATPIPVAPSLSPSALNFAQSGQSESGFTAPQTVTLNNPGQGTLTISGISITGEFRQTNNCPSSLTAGASCVISVSMATTLDSLTKFGTLLVATNANPGQAVVALSGTISGKGGAMPFWLLLPGGLAYLARRRRCRRATK